jgi:hypothetical protein
VNQLPVKQVASVRVSNVDKKSVGGEQPVRLCNYTDVYYHEHITTDLPFMEATATADQIAQFAIRCGDVLVTKDSETPEDIAVPSYVTDNMPNVLCGYHLALLRPRPSISGRYLFWAMASRLAREQFCACAMGITRFGLRHDAFGEVKIPVPSMNLQRAIADYLDAETARIDRLIERKHRLTELVTERVRSFISQATDDPPYMPVRHLTSLRTSGPRGWADRVAELVHPSSGRRTFAGTALTSGSITSCSLTLPEQKRPGAALFAKVTCLSGSPGPTSAG